MKNLRSIKALGIAIPLIVGASQMLAVNITITDYTGLTGAVPGPSWGWNGGPAGQGAEDNETEASSPTAANPNPVSTIRAQVWDLEAFAVDSLKSPTTLYLIGGYNFAAGVASGGHTYTPGDLFIKVGGVASYNPLANTTLPILNGGTYDYTYAVRLSTGVSGAIEVDQLAADSTLDSVVWDGTGSNPWKVKTLGSGSDITDTAVTYTTGRTSAQVATLTGVSGLLDDGAGGATHNIVAINLGFLAGIIPSSGTVTIDFSYTYECGNDMIKAIDSFSRKVETPDGGVTLMLLGIGLTGLGTLRRFIRS